MSESLTYGRLTLIRSLGGPPIALWGGISIGTTNTEYLVIHLLVTHAGVNCTYRQIYDRMHRPGFCAGQGEKGFYANVRSMVKKIRKKFRAVDPEFREINNIEGAGYYWGPLSAEPSNVVQDIRQQECGPLVIYPDLSQAFIRGTAAPFTYSEIGVLSLLITAGDYVSPREIYDAVRGRRGFIAGRGQEGYQANVRSIIRRMRLKLEGAEPGLGNMIKCYPKCGYRIRSEL